jgi:hypothetical protein
MRAASYRRRPASLGPRALRRDRRGEPVRGFQQRMVVGLGASAALDACNGPRRRDGPESHSTFRTASWIARNARTLPDAVLRRGRPPCRPRPEPDARRLLELVGGDVLRELVGEGVALGVALKDHRDALRVAVDVADQRPEHLDLRPREVPPLALAALEAGDPLAMRWLVSISKMIPFMRFAASIPSTGAKSDAATTAVARSRGLDGMILRAELPAPRPPRRNRRGARCSTRLPGGGCQPERLAGTLTMRSTTAPSRPRRWLRFVERAMRRSGISAGVMSP